MPLFTEIDSNFAGFQRIDFDATAAGYLTTEA